MSVIPRRAVAAAAASAVALTVSLAATASSSPPESRSGAEGQKAYASLAKKKDYVKLDVLAINDFHGQLDVVPSTSSSGRINSTRNNSKLEISNQLLTRQIKVVSKYSSSQEKIKSFLEEDPKPLQFFIHNAQLPNQASQEKWKNVGRRW